LVFSSIPFLFWFLPGVLLAHTLAPKGLRNGVLLTASLGFYVWGSGALVLILVFSTITDYLLGRLVGLSLDRGRNSWKVAGLAGSILVNVSLLGYFKYAGFLVDQLNAAGRALGFEQVAWSGPILPIGISFFTFQSMSYTIDIARGRTRHLRNPIDFALFVTLFPQLIAGPIVRFHEISGEIQHRDLIVDRVAGGVVRFCHGLVKKVVIADSVAGIADAVFGAEAVPTHIAWIGVIAFAIQIYFDFSGYSDMAIGLGAMLGFTFPENFKRPYSAESITDFWRRWHITLSTWFRDYLYIPLGGSREGPTITYRNLVLVFLITGLWHGANWTFIAWGAYHGSLLLIERRRTHHESERRTSSLVPRTRTLLLVLIGWTLFRAADISDAWDLITQMVIPRLGDVPISVEAALDTRAIAILVLASTVFFLPSHWSAGARAQERLSQGDRLYAWLLVLVGFPVSVLLISAGSFSPFLYFQF
jgi:alginate O-acetyltransferase complex protein AlgI